MDRSRLPQMEARVMSADTPSRPVTALFGALVMKLGATLVPELVTSTGSEGYIAKVAGPTG